jgi:L-alanine-DL-glutamate epimerase-like enolase superfamily enzyme
MTHTQTEPLPVREVQAIPTSFPVDAKDSVTLGVGRTIKRDAVIVKVVTESGITGWGEAHHGRCPGAVAHIVNTTLKALVVGKDAHDVTGIWNSMYQRQLASHGMGAGACLAVSGIDMALWDIRAKALGIPLYRLLGGTSKPVPAYAGGVSLGYQEPESLVDEARVHVESGYRAVKLRIGDTVQNDLLRVAAARKAFGDDLDILTDANTAYTLNDARAAMPVLDSHSVGWLEEPFPAHDYRSYREARKLRSAAAGSGRESLHTLRIRSCHRGRQHHDPAARPFQNRGYYRSPAGGRTGLDLEVADSPPHLDDSHQHGSIGTFSRSDRKCRLFRGRRVTQQPVPRRTG